MKTGFAQKLETVTNMAILLAVLILGYLFIEKYFLSENTQPQPTEIAKGTKISLPEISWEQNKKTLLLVLQKDCHFCSESMPFYKTLVQKSKEKGIKLVAVLPNSREESIQHLKENGVEIQEVIQASSKNINVQGTPTLILTNDKGEVLNSWIGKLPSEKEQEVIGNL